MKNLSIKFVSVLITRHRGPALQGRPGAIHGQTWPVVLCLAALLASSPFFAGCGSTKVASSPSDSVGQQLLDLEKARREGVIDDKEYERLRRATIKKND